jgi:NADH-quinone oxidoreductase subunit L
MLVALIVILPFAGYLILTFAGKYMSRISGGILASLLVSLSFGLSVAAFFMTPQHGMFLAGPFTWIDTAGFKAAFSLQADSLSLVMAVMVTGVSALIHFYSIGYMKDDPGMNRFFSYLNLFVFFMLLLVTADNYLLLFAGWEGVGLSSYLLIGFWFKNPEYAKAADKAFIMNRIGDLGFLLAIATLYLTFGTLSFTDIQSQLQSGTGIDRMALVTLLLFTGAVGKSAQIPLFTWLPDAMAGPTPVSALIHAATMVTAGIYLVIRSRALFVLSPLSMHVVAAVGIITALFAASVALKQFDIKKILAYSTISQLGLIFYALGLGAFDASLFHLLTHAFFKALLFLCAGSVIHGLHGQQDIRLMGRLKEKVPVTFITMIIGALAISGVPPFSGFFSKDGILSVAMQAGPLFWIAGLAVSLLTAFYMFRLVYLVFYGQYRGEPGSWDHIHESPAIMTTPLVILAILSMISGLINMPALFGGGQWLSNYTGLVQATEANSHLTEWILMIITVLAVTGMIGIARHRFNRKEIAQVSATSLKPLGRLLAEKYYVDELYRYIISNPLVRISDKLYSIVEVKIVDAVVEGIGSTVSTLSRVFRLLQSGSVSFYLFFMVLGIILVLVLNLFK